MTRSKIRTSGAEGLTLSSTDITIDSGDLLFGTSAKGVNLGVTSNTDGNTLDDYEEGTWTPIYLADSSNPSPTYHTQLGRYTKIGRCVTAWAYLRINASSGGSGGASIGGLPFTSENVSGGYVGATIGYAGNWDTNKNPTKALVYPNSQQINLYTQVGTDPRSGNTRVQISDLVESSSSSEVYLSAVYNIA